MKELSENEIRLKAESYCVKAERCSSEVCRKMQQWGATEEQVARVMEHLLAERYLDESRFAEVFARDKMRYNHWGKVKIQYALKDKGVSAHDIQHALSLLDQAEYAEILVRLLSGKRSRVSGRNEYECRQKLIRFALGRGFSMQETLYALEDLNMGEDEDF